MNKLNSFKMYNIAQRHRILHRVAQRLYQQFRILAIFKSMVKQNDNSNKLRTYVHGILPRRIAFV
jgi:hypothetical protein